MPWIQGKEYKNLSTVITMPKKQETQKPEENTIHQLHSIDSAIDYREEDEESEFDEMTARLAEDIMYFFDDDCGDEDIEYEDLKDKIREFLINWREKGMKDDAGI